MAHADVSLIELLLQQANNAITVLDHDGNFMEWSGGATRIFGFDRDEVIGKNVSLIFPADDVTMESTYTNWRSRALVRQWKTTDGCRERMVNEYGSAG